MLLNCGVGEDSWESLGLHGPVHAKGDQFWVFLEGLMLKLKLQYFGHLMRELTHWKRPWCWERLRARGGHDRRWDGWMVSRTQWTWVWVDSGSWWWTGRPGMLQFMGLQRVGHNWVTELNWTLWKGEFQDMWIIAQFKKRKLLRSENRLIKLFYSFLFLFLKIWNT